MIFGVTAIATMPLQSALALNATEVSSIAEAVTVRIDGQNPGSGVIIKRKGTVYTVLTAAHVVATEDNYDVVTPDGQLHKLDYSKVKKFPNVDLALVEFTSSKTYKVADMGDSTTVKVGELIYVSGFPLPTAAITQSIWNFSDGRVKANAKRPLADGYALVYSNDTLPGMSGGAVLNSQGKLIAIHGRADAEQSVQKTETVYQKTGFNLGIPINTFLNLAATLSPNLGFIDKATKTTNTTLTADDWFLQAETNYRKGKYQDTIADLSQAIKINPKYIAAYNNRGLTYLELKQYPQAMADVNQAIKINPNHAESYKNRGNVYLALKQYRQAIKEFDQSIKINPKYDKAYYERGNAYYDLKIYRQATADFTQAIEINPKYADAFLNRGLAYTHLGYKSHAKKSLQKAAQLYKQQNNLKLYQRAIQQIRDNNF